MPSQGRIQSPVVIGRDDLLSLTRRRLEEAASGTGQLLFVAGEAGIGKTRLLSSVAAQAQHQGYAVAHAAAFPDDTESSAGLLLELASGLTRARPAALRRLGQQLSDRLRGGDTAAGDAHRRRRLLVQDLADLVVTADAGAPILVVLEDLHWADQLSLDVLAHLAGRIRTRPLLIAGTYRTEELYPRRPMRVLRARLLTQRLAEELRLPRLGLSGTAELTAAVLGVPAPLTLVRAVFERSDGIPLHVEELLAALGPEAKAPEAHRVQTAEVPETLNDAVLTRAQALSPPARGAASAAAVIGRSFDHDLLAAVTDLDGADVEAALRELREAFLVLRGPDTATFDFRHALIRDALYADTPLTVRRRLHARVARTAAERGYRHAFVSAHYEHAGQRDLAHRHAVSGAREAAGLSAHREALELFRRAVRQLPPDQPWSVEAELYAALGDEAAAMDENAAAAAAYRRAHLLMVTAGDVRGAALLVPRMAAVGHLLGEGLGSRTALLQGALDNVEDLVGADGERAQLRAGMAAAYMLDRRLDEAIEQGERSQGGAPSATDRGVAALNLAATLGSVLVFAGRSDEGWSMLERGIADARGDHQEAEAARGYRMLGTSASVLVEYDRAEQWLTEGIDYANGVELWNHSHYMTSHLAHVQWATGQWAAASRTAEHALADGRGGLTTQITAQYVLGYLALGRGDWEVATGLLDQALVSGERMGELQRLSPPLWGLAEVARCRGDHRTALLLCERGYQISADVTDAAYLYPYLVTGVRAHLAAGELDAATGWAGRVRSVLAVRDLPGARPALDQAAGLLLLAQGDLAGARAALESASESWRLRRRFWEGSWARLDLATLAVRSRRRSAATQLVDEVLAQADQLGARVLSDAARRLDGSGDGSRTRRPWYPLSAREFEVARLVATGLTNRQIAEQLVLAPKTISAHVEHILAKLGAGRRAEIAAWCGTVRVEAPAVASPPTVVRAR